MRNWPKATERFILRGYQRVISPALPPSCRFYPTCSEYALQAVERFGVIRGTGLALWRLLRCHPLHPGGFDPVPEKKTNFRALTGNSKLETRN